MLIVGTKVIRRLPAKYNVKPRHGVIVAIEQGKTNNGKTVQGYRIRFEEDEADHSPSWYCTLGDFIETA